MPETNNAAMSAADQLAALFPPPIEVKLSDGKVIKVPPLGIRRLGQVARPLQRIANNPLADDLSELLASHSEDLIVAVAAATGESEAYVAELQPEDFVKLTVAVLKVNADFFVRRLPALQTEVQEALGTGRTPFNSSPAEATPTPAS